MDGWCGGRRCAEHSGPTKPRGAPPAVFVRRRIPCSGSTGKPLFAQPCGDEAWVMLLEKVFAKYCGSYAALEGGDTLWALEALTGATPRFPLCDQPWEREREREREGVAACVRTA